MQPHPYTKKFTHTESTGDANLPPFHEFTRYRHNSLPLELHSQFHKWDQALKHKDIEVKDAVVRRTKETTDESSVGIMLDLKLEEHANAIYKWAFRVKNKQLYIGVGIGLQKKAKMNGFEEFQWDMLGHGHYVHGSSGGVYSSSDQAINNKQVSFPIQNGDLIEVKYSPVVRELDFTKNQSVKFHMKVDPAPADDCYRPCVYMNRLGDSVEIIKIQ